MAKHLEPILRICIFRQALWWHPVEDERGPHDHENALPIDEALWLMGRLLLRDELIRVVRSLGWVGSVPRTSSALANLANSVVETHQVMARENVHRAEARRRQEFVDRAKEAAERLGWNAASEYRAMNPGNLLAYREMEIQDELLEAHRNVILCSLTEPDEG